MQPQITEPFPPCSGTCCPHSQNPPHQSPGAKFHLDTGYDARLVHTRLFITLPETWLWLRWPPLHGLLGRGPEVQTARLPLGSVTSVPANGRLPHSIIFFARSLSTLFTAWPLTPNCTLHTENNIRAKAFKRPLKGLKFVVQSGFSID